MLTKSLEAIVSAAAFFTSRTPDGTEEGFVLDPTESFDSVWIAIRPNLILHFLFQLVTSEPDMGAENLFGLVIFALSD